MKKLKKFLFIIFYIIMILFVVANSTKLMLQIFGTTVFADVGSFESYGGGGGSSSSSSSSHSGDSEDLSFGSMLMSIAFWIFIFVFTYIVSIILEIKQERYERKIERRIKIHDPNFSNEEFLQWSKRLFIKLQQAWTARDWETIRIFETESLFEQHKNQLQGYINNNQINVMDSIEVTSQALKKYKVEGDKEILTVRLNSRMKDYIIDATTKEVIKGHRGLLLENTYLLTFIRKIGVKTKLGTIEVNITNCPNCGAPMQINSSGKCEYCGSVITTGEHNWALSNLEREIKR